MTENFKAVLGLLMQNCENHLKFCFILSKFVWESLGLGHQYRINATRVCISGIDILHKVLKIRTDKKNSVLVSIKMYKR